MTTKGLTTLVVGYDDVEVAMADLADLAAVHEAHGVGEYEAAVVSIAEAEHEIVATTVDARVRGTVLGAGLGAGRRRCHLTGAGGRSRRRRHWRGHRQHS